MGANLADLQDRVPAHHLANFNNLTPKSVLRSPHYIRKIMNKKQISSLVINLLQQNLSEEALERTIDLAKYG